MTRAPATVRALLLSALSVTALLTAAACSAEERGTARSAPAPSAPATAPAVERPAPVPAPLALDEEQVRAALVTQKDLGEPWVPTRGAATWRDAVLKADAENADCRWLLEVLYTEELFGAPAGPHAVVALDETSDGAQLRHQVAAHRSADVDRVLERLGTLPKTCGRFTATTTRAGAQDVRVEEVPLPEAGDARAALRVTLAGEDADGEPARLTVDVAAVRVGEHAVILTHAGPGAVRSEVTRGVAQLGAERLSEIGRQAGTRV